MRTINLFNSTFAVRPVALTTIKSLQSDGTFTNIQEMLVDYFTRMAGEGVMTDEYALAVAVFFPDSKAWGDNRQARCATDVRQYNKGAFKVQEDELPDRLIKHLDGGKRATTRDPQAALDALAQIEDQLG